MDYQQRPSTVYSYHTAAINALVFCRHHGSAIVKCKSRKLKSVEVRSGLATP